MEFNISEELKKLPKSPGVYLMHDKTGDIIYVGKAKNLFNRVHQYFQEGHKRTQKINQMISHIAYFEYIVVDTELESLILEANLIKENMPRYNTLLKDDKNYPYIKLTTNETYPRIILSRRRYNDKAVYFGPFRSANDVKELINLVRKTYKLRSCQMTINENKNQKRECLYFHIDACLAPCVNKNIKEEYSNNVKEAVDFLNGKYENALDLYNKKMIEYSQNEEFEKAAQCRDIIFSINSLKDKQKINQNFDDRDIIGLYKENDYAAIQLFVVRDGKIVDRISKILAVDIEDETSKIMEDFIKQYYNDSPFIPSEILLSENIQEDEKILLEKWLSRNNTNSKKTKLTTPKIGNKEKLIMLANNNAKISLKLYLDRNKNKNESINKALDELKTLLSIDSLHRIESYDISNISGTNSVASMVCFIDGLESKKDYRKYKIKTVEGANDYASMEEVLSRRLSKIDITDNENETINLLLIDGGKGQVNVALSVVKKLGLKIPVCGMVKDDNHRTRGLWYNDKEIALGKESFKLVTNIQDETHRFAITYHKLLRSKEQIHSVLDDIKGLGPKKRIELIKYFKTIEAIKSASIEELLTCPKVDKSTAKAIYSYFKK